MIIGIDLNGVIRNFNKSYAFYYCKEYDQKRNIENMDFKNINLDDEFKFESDKEKKRFLYENYPYEICGCAKECEKGIINELNKWMSKIEDDIDENVEFVFVSPMEIGRTIISTYFFLSRYNTMVREVFMPKNSSKVWDKCDILITANPLFDKSFDKKSGKKMYFIKNNVNEKIANKYENYDSLSQLIKDEKVIDYIKEKKDSLQEEKPRKSFFKRIFNKK